MAAPPCQDKAGLVERKPLTLQRAGRLTLVGLQLKRNLRLGRGSPALSPGVAGQKGPCHYPEHLCQEASAKDPPTEIDSDIGIEDDIMPGKETIHRFGKAIHIPHPVLQALQSY